MTYTDEDFELDFSQLRKLTYPSELAWSALDRIIAYCNRWKWLAENPACEDEECQLALLAERDALKAEVERLTSDLRMANGVLLSEDFTVGDQVQLAAAEKVCEAVDKARYYSAEVDAALAAWEATKEER